MGKVTNKDIAERAGVSAAAVSLAIHGRKGISEATRANILRIVQEMNYAPPSRSCTDSRAVVLIPGTGLRMPPPALLQSIADFAAQQRAQLHILTLQQLMVFLFVRQHQKRAGSFSSSPFPVRDYSVFKRCAEISAI